MSELTDGIVIAKKIIDVPPCRHCGEEIRSDQDSVKMGFLIFHLRNCWRSWDGK